MHASLIVPHDAFVRHPQHRCVPCLISSSFDRRFPYVLAVPCVESCGANIEVFIRLEKTSGLLSPTREQSADLSSGTTIII
jgi:hypothetical protein